MTESFEARCLQAVAVAKQAAAETTEWRDRWNRMFGVGGGFGSLFPTVEDRTRFINTPEYKEVMSLLESVDSQQLFQSRSVEASGKMNIRIPKSLHAALQVEAEKENVSINQLIVAKLSCQLSEVMSH